MVKNSNYPPRKLILDIMRAYSPESLSISTLITVGALFAHNENSIRVMINRLCNCEYLVKTGRAQYSLGAKTKSSLSHLIPWRDIHQAPDPAWDGSWYMAAQPHLLSRQSQKRSNQVLHMFGFRSLATDFSMRPANVLFKKQELQLRMENLGAACPMEISRIVEVSASLSNQWQQFWTCESWPEQHQSASAKLSISLANLHTRPIKKQLTETLVLGGHSIGLLLNDPILPLEFDDGIYRKQHGALMLEYDAKARSIWHDLLTKTEQQQNEES